MTTVAEKPDLGDILASVMAREFDRARTMAGSVAEAASRAPVETHGPARAPRVSIIVVVSCDAKNSVLLLDALIGISRDPDFEIHLLSSGATGLVGAARARLTSFKFTDLGCNTGPSIARNIGAGRAYGRAVMFLDDDGRCGADDITALAACVLEDGAVAARGRLRPAKPVDRKPPHYDLGEVSYTPPSTEGFSVWNRDAFLHLGGFDPAMFGHEGLELTHRALAVSQVEAFHYCDAACFVHDYASDASRQRRKDERHCAMDAYMQWRGTSMEDVLRRFDPTRR